MKRFFCFLLPLMFTAQMTAQLNDGSIAPDFTASDTDGNSWNLYSLLDDGKIVVLNIFGAWDSYAWQYQQSGELQQFFSLYGPEGTNQVVVLNIEAEPSNTLEQLYGPELLSGDYATETQGDWLTGNPIPVIDNAAIADSLQVNYLPTVFMICPDRMLSELSQVNAQLLFEAMNGLSCPVIMEGFDPALINGSISGLCGTSGAQISFVIKNVGTESITDLEIAISGVETPFTYMWSGNLLSYMQQVITLENVALLPNTNVVMEITTVDINTDNNEISLAGGFVQSTLHIQLELGLDNWADEVSWEIRDSNDSIMFSGGDFTVPYQYFNNTYVLPADGCYSFYLRDTQGDGLHGSQWGGFDGSCYVRGLDIEGNPMVTIYSYDGSYDFSSILSAPSFQKAEFEALNALSVESLSENLSWNIYPNPSNGKVSISAAGLDTKRTQISIINSIGAVVHTIRPGAMSSRLNTLELNVEFLDNGLYHLRAGDGTHTFTTPLLIVH